MKKCGTEINSRKGLRRRGQATLIAKNIGFKSSLPPIALSSRLGRNAVESLLYGEKGKMVGQVRNRIVLTDLEEVLGTCKMVDLEMIELTDCALSVSPCISIAHVLV